MSNGWIYDGQVIDDESQFPEGTLGFVYVIENVNTGRKYFGKKLALFQKTTLKTVKLKSGEKRKKKIRTKVPSDWKTYWGSSEELLKDIEKLGVENFKREILCFCSSKGSLSYEELCYQMDNRVLENRDKFYNGIVNVRISHQHLKPILK